MVAQSDAHGLVHQLSALGRSVTVPTPVSGVLCVQALCVNDSVLKLGALTRINERCLEMLQAKPTKKQATGESNKKPKVCMSIC